MRTAHIRYMLSEIYLMIVFTSCYANFSPNCAQIMEIHGEYVCKYTCLSFIFVITSARRAWLLKTLKIAGRILVWASFSKFWPEDRNLFKTDRFYRHYKETACEVSGSKMAWLLPCLTATVHSRLFLINSRLQELPAIHSHWHCFNVNPRILN